MAKVSCRLNQGSTMYCILFKVYFFICILRPVNIISLIFFIYFFLFGFYDLSRLFHSFFNLFFLFRFYGLSRLFHSFFFYLLVFIWVLLPVKIISLILSQVNCEVGRKWEISKKNHLTSCKQNLACLTYDPS